MEDYTRVAGGVKGCWGELMKQGGDGAAWRCGAPMTLPSASSLRQDLEFKHRFFHHEETKRTKPGRKTKQVVCIVLGALRFFVVSFARRQVTFWV
jgi:hypothetical protein